jgi:hypothetical protein
MIPRAFYIFLYLASNRVAHNKKFKEGLKQELKKGLVALQRVIVR